MSVWIRLSVSAAAVAAFGMVLAEWPQAAVVGADRRWALCAVLLGTGVGLFLLGRWLKRRRHDELPAERISLSLRTDAPGRMPAPGPAEPFLLLDPAFLGVLLILFGVLVMVVVPGSSKMGVAARLASPLRVAARTVVVAAAAPTEVHFPEMVFQGLVCRPKKSLVIFDGNSYAVGERVHGAKVVSITPRTVTLSMRGLTRVLDVEAELLRRGRR
ncbi:MAG: hypothetical protein JXQ71_04095 [Verrucomicrobia bacterium]|nr:hypothetical protein [Verrucomicrobiota bacterium]